MDDVVAGVRDGRDATRQGALLTAQQIIELVSSGYGPGGGRQLITGLDDMLLESGASSLREMHLEHPQAQPYKDLATTIQANNGDGGSTAILLAAELVRLAMEAQPGVPAPASVRGYEMARRQALAIMSGAAKSGGVAELLEPMMPNHPGAGRLVADGLASLAEDNRIDLDDVDIRIDDELAWAEGLIVEPKWAPTTRQIPDARVLLVHAATLPKVSANLSVTSPAMLGQMRDAERDRRTQIRDKIVQMGVKMVASLDAFDEDLALALASAGVAVLSNQPKSHLRRIEAATGATMAARLQDAGAENLGYADLRQRGQRKNGWLLTGPGPSATLQIPGKHTTVDAMHVDSAERMLRAAGPIMIDSRRLDGGGRWQRNVAAGLAKSADVVPGRPALAIRAAGQAFAKLVDIMVANTGADPIDKHDLGLVPDSFACMSAAVSAAFELAIELVRIDATYQKRPSAGDAMRGGSGPSGSPLGMPGDIPPLM